MKWLHRFGRLLMVLSLGFWALIFVYLGWVTGAFDSIGFFGVPFTQIERLMATLEVLGAIALTVIAGLIWRPGVGKLVLVAMAISVLGLGLFMAVEGWGDDLFIALAGYPVLGLGYWLNRL